MDHSSITPEVAVIPRWYETTELRNDVAERMRNLRLKALQTDPASFGSTYEKESHKPLEFWIDRLQAEGAQHFVVMKPNQPALGADTVKKLLDSEWIALLVLIGPKNVDCANFSYLTTWLRFFYGDGQWPNPQNLSTSEPSYHMVSVWVALEHRRQGLARLLIEEANTTIESEVRALGKARAISLIAVEGNNIPARHLYEKVGFYVISEDHHIEKDGRRIEDIVLRQDVFVQSGNS